MTNYVNYLSNPYIKAFLDTVAWAEGGTYNKLYGGGTFTGNQHPNRAIKAGAYTSTAAGRYQFLYSTWKGLQNKLGLTDFSPNNQDIGAIALIDERGQLGKIASGDLVGTLKGLGCLWAALPYATCKQKTRDLTQTINYFNNRVKQYGGNNVTPTINAITTSANNLTGNNNTVSKKDDTKNNNNTYAVIGIALVLLLVSR